MEVYLPQNGAVVRTIQDVELLTKREVRGILRMGLRKVTTFLNTLPPGAVIREPNGGRIRVHAWALAKYLQMDRCPGCGRTWPEQEKK